jgi:vacuolar-type H+-ATPase subunit I/STV1
MLLGLHSSGYQASVRPDQEALSVMSLSITRITRTLASVVVAGVVAVAAQQASAQSLDKAIATQGEADKAAASSQKRINEIRDRLQDAASRYATAIADAESLEKYNSQLEKQVKAQQDEVSSIEAQLLEIETTSREVQPLMQRMVDTLEKFVSLDTPFLLEERSSRVDTLQEIMPRADVTISEKYRRIIEAYQIELEYGRTLESYDGLLGSGPDARTVSFVRLGRVALLYQTLDGAETGYWDAEKRDWVVDNSYAAAVAEARRVAEKDGPPNLLTVPVPAPKEARS